MKENIVLTYFEPFQGRKVNASKEVVTSLSSSYKTFELPVSWNRIEEKIEDILSSSPSYLFLTGEAGSYSSLTLETLAHNIANGTDNDGVEKKNERISDGPESLSTPIDCSSMDIFLSINAGKFLCNYSYYLALSKAKTTKVLFIHFPFLKEEGGSYEKEELVEAFKNLIESISFL